MSNNVDFSKILDYLPTAGNNRSISVGFEDISALNPLRTLLIDIFQKHTGEIKRIEDENTAKQQKAWANYSNNFISKLRESIENEQKARQQAEKDARKNFELQNEIAESIKENIKDNKELKQFLIRGVNVAIDLLDKHIENAVKVGGVFRDLESNGVFLKNGFNDVGKSAYELGMTYDDLAGHLKRTSPLIARLNSNMGDGLKAFTTSISNIDKSLNLTNNEKVGVLESWLNNVSPSQLLNMTQEQMNVEINKTAKEMKMLSLATGKSVDLINKENEQKAATLRQQVWKRNHSEAYKILQQLGITDDQEMMDYIMSGGTRATGNIITKMQNDPFMQKMLPEMIRQSATNTLNMSSLSALYNQNKHLAGYKSAYADKASYNPGLIAASAASDLFQNTQFYEFNSMFQKLNLNDNVEELYYGPNRKNANRAMNNWQNLGENKARAEVAKQTALSGGEEGVGNVTAGGNIFYKGLAKLYNLYNEYAPSGTAGALGLGAIEGIAGTTVKTVLDSFGFKTPVNTFKKAVDKFALSVGLNDITNLKNNSTVKKIMNGGLLDTIDGRTKFGRKFSWLKKANNWVGNTKLGKNINLGFGKHKLKLGAVGSGIVKGGLLSGGGWLLGAGNDYLKEKGYVDEGSTPDNIMKYGSNMASYAGQGAMLGSIIGPWGTAIGAGLGALYGGYKTWKENSEMKAASQSEINNQNKTQEYEQYSLRNSERSAKATEQMSEDLRTFITQTQQYQRNATLNGNYPKIPYYMNGANA